jgi:hypothetical protein
VDAAYLKRATPGRLDSLKLKTELEERNAEPLYESYFLTAVPNAMPDEEQAFYTWLKTAPPSGPPMRVQLYQRKTQNATGPTCDRHFERPVQKGVDVASATVLLKQERGPGGRNDHDREYRKGHENGRRDHDDRVTERAMRAENR